MLSSSFYIIRDPNNRISFLKGVCHKHFSMTPSQQDSLKSVDCHLIESSSHQLLMSPPWDRHNDEHFACHIRRSFGIECRRNAERNHIASWIQSGCGVL